jgi:predicted outer membrane repeat protein
MVTVRSSLFQHNDAQKGGAIFNDGGTVKLTGDAFDTNSAATQGGAVVNAAGTMAAGNCTFFKNKADSEGAVGGGAIYISGGKVSIVGVDLVKNTAPNGGGIYVGSGNLTLSSSSVADNSADRGGGIYNKGSITVVDTEFTDNSAGLAGAGLFGGAIYNRKQMSVRDSGFTHNKAGSTGGAISNSGTGAATISGCTFASNSAPEYGGGIALSSGQLTLINSTVAENSSPNGAGIADNAQLTAINDTIADNTSPGGGGFGGGLYVDKSTNFLYNTIVAQNTSGTSPATASDITFSDGGSVTGSYNLIGTGGSGGLVNMHDGNLVGVADPGLGNLAFNGGPSETIALLAGSPAIDAGSNSISGVTVPTIDQRGALRGPAGLNAGATVDIGAYEAS